jgi:hexokinase
MERIKDIEKMKHLGIDPNAEMAINCEWVRSVSWVAVCGAFPDCWNEQGAFDSFEHEHLPRTKYDTIVDESSNKPGEQAFEVSPPY